MINANLKTLIIIVSACIPTQLYAQNTYPWPATGAVSVGTTYSYYNFNAGEAQIGEAADPTNYGRVQIARLANQGDNKFHLSFIRSGMKVAGLGFAQNSNTFGIWNADNNLSAPALSFTHDQRIGIGILSPSEKLTIKGANGNIHIGNLLYGDYNGICLNGSTVFTDYNFLSKASDNNLYINRPAAGYIFFRLANATQMSIAPNGNVGIGIDVPQAKLAVNGEIFSRKVKVTQTGWPDYVFHPSYELPSLEEIEKYIHQHHHLPDVPSAEEVGKNGLDLGDTQAALLKKIEELTLYMIEIKKENEQMKKEIKELQKRK